MINFAIMKHPLNWITVFLMLLIAVIFIHFLREYISPKTNSQG